MYLCYHIWQECTQHVSLCKRVPQKQKQPQIVCLFVNKLFFLDITNTPTILKWRVIRWWWMINQEITVFVFNPRSHTRPASWTLRLFHVEQCEACHINVACRNVAPHPTTFTNRWNVNRRFKRLFKRNRFTWTTRIFIFWLHCGEDMKLNIPNVKNYPFQ